ncbi:MAG: fatty acid--CoA ligase family protein [Bacteroidales bacterium]|nr:fatty acid--CoA ligase family protein [Bacteroidales bacterium]MDY0216500.1 fatty acid--CoA ligase family protein [Bacteroidales bacterium]
MVFFLKDIEQVKSISWSFLIQDINTSLSYNPYCKSARYYDVFKHIIISLIFGKEIILLDSDFTDSELKKLTGYSEYEKFNQVIDKKNLPIIGNKEELIEILKKTSDDWKISLFTSGTTGIPQKVTHNFSSITRFVKISDQNTNSIWGFAYNPTHMAGIQVFFQALLNGNSIVRLFGLNPLEIHQKIQENNITHISATPTFYRLFLPCKEVFQSVRRITSGGEKFNEKMIVQLSEIFPNAKITNVYASTEAGTLFATENDIFTIKAENEHFIRILDDELLIHSNLMGSTDRNIDEWFKTGDLVEVISENPLQFRFISRKTDMINIGGYKVNPLEVEEAILSLPEIKNARVYSKSNSVMGNIICCEVVCDNKEITESSVRTFLQSKLQEFKIPRIILFVSELSTTRTGKIKRN